MITRSLFSRLIKISPLKWQRVLEDSSIIKSLLNRIQLIIADGLTKELCICAHLFVKEVVRLGRSGGWLLLALYLKQCSSSLMIAYGGDQVPSGALAHPVSLNRSGFPRIIPPFIRRRISKRDARADLLVKLYLSWFSLYRIILLAKKISKETFTSIVFPVSDLGAVQEFMGDVKHLLRPLIRRYIPGVSTVPLNQGFVWTPTWKTVPTMSQANSALSKHHKDQKSVWKGPYRTFFITPMFEMAAFASLLEFIHSYGEQFSQGILWPSRVRYAFDKNNKRFTEWDLEEFERTLGPYFPTASQLGLPPIFGRLGQAIQQGTKRRLFSIGNYFNQQLLAPVHTWASSLLKLIPMDGTYNQERPLDLLKGNDVCYCYDLSSATDRWPLLVMFEFVSSCFDHNFASGAVNSALATATFEVPFVRRRRPVQSSRTQLRSQEAGGSEEGSRTKVRVPSFVSFIAGQPLGLKSSWPLFALSHHLVVWIAAERVYPGQRFVKYAVLGDDVVICDDRVAAEYLNILSVLQVKISFAKSLVSHRGCGEFAKRFRVRGLSVDLSPVSVAALLNYYHPYGLMSIHDKYPLRRFSTLCRIGGMGYKGLSSINSRLSARFTRLKLFFTKALTRLNHISLELWLGDMKPLDPYIRGAIIDFLRGRFIPKDIQRPYSELYVYFKVEEFSEYTVLRNWMSMWLKYLHWYATKALSPDVTIDDFFLKSVPTIEKTFLIRQTDEEICRFGLFWKVFDLITEYRVGKRHPPLPLAPPDFSEHEIKYGFMMIVGGSAEYHNFLVRPEGLINLQDVYWKAVLIKPKARQSDSIEPPDHKTVGESDC